MSPDANCEFEAQWPPLERRSRAFLSRKRVPGCDQEDLLQETAMRLLGMWDSIDQSRSLWPLTSTILLNLLRDRSRSAPLHQAVALLPEVEAPHDVERSGLARVELDRVRRAMDHLSSSHRSILMQELRWTDPASRSPAEKMLRMRARRKLRSILEKVSGLVVLRARRITELGDKVFALRDGAATTASCVICLILGVGGVVATPSSLTPKASAEPSRSESIPFTVDMAETGSSQEVGAALSLQDGIAEAVRAKEVARTTTEARDERKSRRRAKHDATAEEPALLPGLPLGDGDGPGVPSAPSVSADTSRPEVPSTEPGDGPSAEPPSPPEPPVSALPPTDDLLEEVAELL